MPSQSGVKILGKRAATGGAFDWPNTRLSRAAILALIEALNANLLAAHTATAALDQWCSDHKLGPGPIRAKVVAGMDSSVSDEQRRRLQIEPNEPVKYRRVELACGERVLSEADNWYVPSRLNPDINAVLETSDTPFGRAVLDLKPIRETFAVETFWNPLPDGWDETPLPPSEPREAPLFIPWRLFQHRALVYGGDSRPFAEVNETYTREILALGDRST